MAVMPAEVCLLAWALWGVEVHCLLRKFLVPCSVGSFPVIIGSSPSLTFTASAMLFSPSTLVIFSHCTKEQLLCALHVGHPAESGHTHFRCYAALSLVMDRPSPGAVLWVWLKRFMPWAQGKRECLVTADKGCLNWPL